MDQKQIYAYLKTKYSQDEAREALYRAASIANDLNWPFMETSFQLGEKGKEDGLDKETIEATIRRAYARERRARERKQDAPSGSEPVATTAVEATPAVQLDEEAIELLQRRRIDPDALNIPWPTEDWRKDLVKLLEACFHPEDTFDFKIADTPNLHREKVANIVAQAEGINKVMRSLDSAGGALMGINAVATESVREDGWRFRYVLVESPRMDLAKQLAYLKALNLPCAAVIATGSNSLQAWVRIEATDSTEYSDRVDFLFTTLESNGFKVDHTCKASNQMVRMPGVLREGKQQYLIGLQQGAQTWKEWKDWVDYCLDGNPLVELASNHPQAPVRDSQLIEGILRPGQFLVLSAPPKAGKSLALVDLALSLCIGGDWIGTPTSRTDVLFVNMELTKAAFLNRIHDVAKSKGYSPDTARLGFLNLRGTTWEPNELAAFLAKRVRGARKYEGREYKVIIIDPITALAGATAQAGGPEVRAAVLQQAVDTIVAACGAAVVGALPSTGGAVLPLNPDGTLELSPMAERHGSFQITGKFREFPSLVARECTWRYPVFLG